MENPDQRRQSDSSPWEVTGSSAAPQWLFGSCPAFGLFAEELSDSSSHTGDPQRPAAALAVQCPTASGEVMGYLHSPGCSGMGQGQALVHQHSSSYFTPNTPQKTSCRMQAGGWDAFTTQHEIHGNKTSFPLVRVGPCAQQSSPPKDCECTQEQSLQQWLCFISYFPWQHWHSLTRDIFLLLGDTFSVFG